MEAANKAGKLENDSSSTADSSSDEEENARLKEAVVGIITEKANNLKDERNKEKENKKQAAIGKKSLRTSLQDEIIEDELLQATPEFKEFVSKQLSKHLENLISDVQVKEEQGNMVENINNGQEGAASGIKLFGSSSKSVVSEESHIAENTKRRLKRTKSSCQSSDSEEEGKRLAQVAVSADYIIANSSKLQNTNQYSSSENDGDNAICVKKNKKQNKKKKRKDIDKTNDAVKEIKTKKKDKKKHKNEGRLETNDKNATKKRKMNLENRKAS